MRACARAAVESDAFEVMRARAREFGASTVVETLANADASVEALAAARALAHDALHCGRWDEVDERWRAVYALATIRWVAASGVGKREATRALDLACVLGGETFGDEARRAIDVARASGDEVEDTREGFWDRAVERSSASIAMDEGRRTERRAYAETSMETFYRDFMAKRDEDGSEWSDRGSPVVLVGLASHWPAISKWRDRAYLDAIIGDRTVPIELGKTYVDEQWSQKLMTVREFMDQYLSDHASDHIGYLAQHELFEQCPELRRDIETPLYCSLGSGAPCAVNAWFGPANTESPAHTDPKHNLLCQIVGIKRVRLFAPNQTPRMYPREAPSSNTSRVDVMAPDLEEFPLFAEAEFVDAVLTPGDALYIPPGWWHRVVAETPSFSVSFWWD